MEDENISKLHLSGFSKCDVSIRRFLATVAFTAYPVESALGDLLLDDRLLRFSNDMWERAIEELDYVRTLPIQVWDRLARTADHTRQGAT